MFIFLDSLDLKYNAYDVIYFGTFTASIIGLCELGDCIEVVTII